MLQIPLVGKEYRIPRGGEKQVRALSAHRATMQKSSNEAHPADKAAWAAWAGPTRGYTNDEKAKKAKTDIEEPKKEPEKDVQNMRSTTSEEETKEAKLDIEGFLAELVESFVPAWPSWDEVQQMVKEKGSAAPSKEIARSEKGQTEHEFFSEKLDKCAAALDDLTPYKSRR